MVAYSTGTFVAASKTLPLISLFWADAVNPEVSSNKKMIVFIVAKLRLEPVRNLYVALGHHLVTISSPATRQ